MKFDYKPFFDNKFTAFYLYKLGGDRLGYLPCGIDIVYRNTHLTTISIMQMLNAAYMSNKNVRQLPWICDHKLWYRAHSFDNSKLLQFHKQITKLIKVSKE